MYIPNSDSIETNDPLFGLCTLETSVPGCHITSDTLHLHWCFRRPGAHPQTSSGSSSDRPRHHPTHVLASVTSHHLPLDSKEEPYEPARATGCAVGSRHLETQAGTSRYLVVYRQRRCLCQSGQGVFTSDRLICNCWTILVNGMLLGTQRVRRSSWIQE